MTRRTPRCAHWQPRAAHAAASSRTGRPHLNVRAPTTQLQGKRRKPATRRSSSKEEQPVTASDAAARAKAAADAAQQLQADTRPYTRLNGRAGDITDALNAAGAGKSAGLDGWRFEHVWLAAGQSATAAVPDDEGRAPGNEPENGQQMQRVFNTLLTRPEAVPESVLRLFRAAALTALGDKRRPIACSGVLRRLLGSTVARALKAELAPTLQQHSQWGYVVSGGVEHAATEQRLWHETGGVLVLLDCENAFNSIDAKPFCWGWSATAPVSYPYSTPSIAAHTHRSCTSSYVAKTEPQRTTCL